MTCLDFLSEKSLFNRNHHTGSLQSMFLQQMLAAALAEEDWLYNWGSTLHTNIESCIKCLIHNNWGVLIVQDDTAQTAHSSQGPWCQAWISIPVGGEGTCHALCDWCWVVHRASTNRWASSAHKCVILCTAANENLSTVHKGALSLQNHHDKLVCA